MTCPRIAVLTTGRADYGLLHPLLSKLFNCEHFKTELLVTGTHLSALHGETVTVIKRDNFKISGRIYMSADGDAEKDICDAIAKGVRGFSDVFNRQRYNLLILLGDRYELISAATAAMVHKIPIAHIHGGESTLGLIDDPIRHSVTKMSAMHFAATNTYANRIIQMGENPAKVHVVGALGIDNIRRMRLLGVKELSLETGVDFSNGRVALLTYHPVTLDDYNCAAKPIQSILAATLTRDLVILATMPNSDTGSGRIYEVLRHYVKKYPNRVFLRKNLGQRTYLSAMKHARLMIGNSSSGIIESASFPIPVVNIGDRQGGRLKPANVIDCDCSGRAVSRAIKKALSPAFAQSLPGLRNPYGDGKTAARIVGILKHSNLSDRVRLLKKGFYDLPVHSIENNIAKEKN